MQHQWRALWNYHNAYASAGQHRNVGTIIEIFVARQFPNTVSHYWVINETRWDGDEMTVGMHAIVKEQLRGKPPYAISCR